VQNRKRKSLQQKMSSDFHFFSNLCRRFSSSTGSIKTHPSDLSPHPAMAAHARHSGSDIAHTNNSDLHLPTSFGENNTNTDGRASSILTLTHINAYTPSPAALASLKSKSRRSDDYSGLIEDEDGAGGGYFRGEESQKSPTVDSLDNKLEQGEIFSRQSRKTMSNQDNKEQEQEKEEVAEEKVQLMKIDVGRDEVTSHLELKSVTGRSP
jgi:hypothetical protein